MQVNSPSEVSLACWLAGGLAGWRAWWLAREEEEGGREGEWASDSWSGCVRVRVRASGCASARASAHAGKRADSHVLSEVRASVRAVQVRVLVRRESVRACARACRATTGPDSSWCVERHHAARGRLGERKRVGGGCSCRARHFRSKNRQFRKQKRVTFIFSETFVALWNFFGTFFVVSISFVRVS